MSTKPDKSYTNRYQKHTPPQRILLPHKVFWRHTYSQEPVAFVKEYDDDDVAQIFIDTLEKNTKDIYEKFKFPKSMIMIMHDKTAYDNSTLCHIFNEERGKNRVRDHCHLSGSVFCWERVYIRMIMLTAWKTRWNKPSSKRSILFKTHGWRYYRWKLPTCSYCLDVI